MNGIRFALAVTVLAVTACGGGSGSPSGALQGNVPSQENSPPLSNVNGSVRGTYFSSGQNGEGD